MSSRLALTILAFGIGFRAMAVLPAEAAAQGTVGQLYCDDFNRVSIGPSWVADNLSFSIVGNQIAEDSGAVLVPGQLRWLGGTTDTVDQVGKLQLFSTQNDTFGFMFRVNGTPGAHYEVHLRAGSDVWRWERYDPLFVEVKASCVGDFAPSDGDYVGATIEGTGASTTVSVWRWSSDPDAGGPVHVTNNWGPPDCTMQGVAAPFVDTGLSLGLRAFAGTSTSFELGDNWCGGDVAAVTATATCVIDADCDDGNACNGLEFCDTQGACQPGNPPACGVCGTCNGTASASFVDHFDQVSVDTARWTVTTAGGGSAAVSGDSFVAFNAATGTDVGFLYHNTPIDLARSQTWMFCVRRNSGDSVRDFIGLWAIPDGQTPQGATTASLAAELRVSAGLVNLGATPSLRFTYRQTTDGGLRQWDGEPSNVWAAVGASADAVDAIRDGAGADWYIIGVQLDAATQRIRLLSQHRAATAIADGAQGAKIVSLTDWVSFADIGIGVAGESLWLTVGDRDTTALSAAYDLEWVRFEAADAVQGWTNARAVSTDRYALRQHTSYGTQFIPFDRDTIAIPAGAPGTWDERGHRKKHIIRDSDGIFYMFREGFDAASESAIGLSSSSTPDGPWTPVAGNPIIPRTVLPVGGAAYDVITAPWAIKDIAEPDPQKLWRLFVTGEVRSSSTHRVFLLRAPAITGPWTMVIGPGPDGSILGESGALDWRNDGVNDALVTWDAANERWDMLCGGIRAGFGWSVGHATSMDLVNWTETVGNPVVAADVSTIQAWTSVSGRTVTVPDGTAYSVDSIVIARNANTSENWGMSRIRRINGNNLELYHEIAGLGGVNSSRVITAIGSGSITPHALVLEAAGGYRLYVTAFQPFILASGSFGNSELVGSLTAPSPTGPWTWDHLGSANVPPNIWNADRAQENLGIVNAPVVRTVVDVAIRAVDVASPTLPEEGPLPTGMTTVCSGRDFLVEVWVMQVNGGTDGLVGGSLDLLFDPTTLGGVSIDHGSVFSDIPHADIIDNVGGRIDDFGGATLQAGKGVGNWALLARVQMSISGSGPTTLSLAPGAFAFALAGGTPPLPNGAVDLTETLVLDLIPTDDGNPCTTDICNADGTVVHPPSFNIAAECCNPSSGVLTLIDDINVCTDDTCDAVTGNVTHTANILPCDDGNACTTSDVCAASVCVGGPAPNCDDSVTCTTDTCNTLTGCVNTTVNAACDDADGCTTDTCDAVLGCLNDGTGVLNPCDDGNACTTNDACQGDAAGTCAGVDTSIIDCDDAIACTTDTCNTVTGCVNTTVNAACDDADVCTTDTCDAALGCLNDGTSVLNACDDGNACTTSDVCQGDAAGTCAGVDTSAVDCDDTIACTSDTCNSLTGCVNTTVDAACDDANVCTSDTCDAALGCLNDGTGVSLACDDGNACTTSDVCQGDVPGSCAGVDTSAVDCDDAIACTTDTCDPITGCSNTTVDAACDDANVCTSDTCDAALGCLNDGTNVFLACDDGNACTTSDVCQGDVLGSCAGVDTSAIDCDDAIACTTDTCNSLTGCVNTTVDAACDDANVCTSDTCDAALGCLNDGTSVLNACDDGNACTTSDVCQGDAAGTCAGVDTSAVDCDDAIACTTDTCNSLTGCVNTTVDAACNDANVCTADVCNAALGCLNDGTGVSLTCDDGNACTTSDACQGDVPGSCAGVDTSVVDCDDAIACTTDTCNTLTGCVNTTVDAVCDDADVCTTDTCDAALGCLNDGTGVLNPCDDGNACTTSDACQGDAGGTCAGVDTSAIDCDDSIACTTDTCNTLTGCVNTTVDAACDDANPCTTDTCDAATGCLNRKVIYDLDLSDAIDFGDFALFAPHFGSFEGVSPNYLDCADFFRDGVIEAADVSFFATAIGQPCDDPSIALPDAAHTPPLPCPMPASGTTTAVAGTITVELRLALLEARSLVSAADAPPESLRGSAEIGNPYFLEIWVRMFGPNAAGVTGGTIDLYLDPALLTIENAAVDPAFGLFAQGEIDPALGIAKTVGGGALTGGIAVDQWVRFATIDLTAASQGVSALQVGVGDLGFAQFGVGAIPDSDVMTPVQRASVRGKLLRTPGRIRSLSGR